MELSNLDITTLGNVLRAFRVNAGISQEKLAERASLHRTYIGSVERGERNPSFKSLNRILNSLKVTWSVFGQKLDTEFSEMKND